MTLGKLSRDEQTWDQLFVVCMCLIHGNDACLYLFYPVEASEIDPGSVLETNLGPRPVYEMISLLTLSLVLPSFFTPTLICLLYIYLHGYTHSQGCRLQLSLTFSISSSINSATGATTHPPHLCPHVSPPPHRSVAVSGPFHACTSLPR